MIKYYFVNTTCLAYGRLMDAPQTFVTDMHPFIKCHELNKMDNYETVLKSWQEITKEEYDLFNNLENQD